MKRLEIKRIWRQWVAAMLVVVMVTMTPFQSVAEYGGNFQTGNDAAGDEILLVDDRGVDATGQIHSPSDAELSTPSDINLMRTGGTGSGTGSSYKRRVYLYRLECRLYQCSQGFIGKGSVYKRNL